jgi:hypothetical protein
LNPTEILGKGLASFLMNGSDPIPGVLRMLKLVRAVVATSVMMTCLILPAAFASGSAKSADCKEVAEDLKAMQKAQQSISESLISNHDLFANLLTDYSSALNMSAELGKPVTKDAVMKMGESAKSFRSRGQNAEKLNKKLTVASNDVIERAILCLKK